MAVPGESTFVFTLAVMLKRWSLVILSLREQKRMINGQEAAGVASTVISLTPFLETPCTLWHLVKPLRKFLHCAHIAALSAFSYEELYFTSSNSTCRFPWGRSCVSSPRWPHSRCLLWPKPYRATCGRWSPCCPPRSWATPVGWCTISAGRAGLVHSCRRVWRREPDSTRTGCVAE